MSNNADQVRVAANGAVHVAPAGTAVPTALDALAGTYVNLGYTSEDGVGLSVSTSREPVKVWQAVAPVRYLLTGKEVSLKMALAQFSKDTLPLYLGGGTVTASGVAPNEVYKITIPDTDEVDERVLVIDAEDGDYTYRYVFPRVMVSETDDVTLKRTEASFLGLTMMAMQDATDGLGYVLTDDPAFDPTP